MPQTKTNFTPKGVSDTALEAGMKLAHFMFAQRGGHSEIHLNEAELAAAFAVCYQDGMDGRVRSYPTQTGGILK